MKKLGPAQFIHPSTHPLLYQKGGEQGSGGGGGAVFQAPAIYTFRAKNDFAEDSLFRHIEPSHAFHLDLVRRMNGHYIFICVCNMYV